MFSHAVKLFSFFGFEIKVDPSWLIIAGLITWSLSQSYFPNALPDVSAAAYFGMAVIGMIGLFASLLLHELAHSVIARLHNVPIKSITLFIFGGMAEMGADPASPRVEFRIAIAGPIMSFCLAAAFWVFSHLAFLMAGPSAAHSVLTYLALVNLVLALFNLVPAFPLDGGRILRAYLWHRSGDSLTATKSAARAGTLFAYLLMMLGLAALFQGAVATGLWQVMIGAFVLMAARASYASQLATAVFKDKTVSDVMMINAVTASPDMTLSELVNHIILRKGVSFVPVLDGQVLLGHIDQTIVTGVDPENWGNTRVGDVFVGLEAGMMIPPDTPVPDLLAKITTTGRRKFMVVAGHDLRGVITLADLTRYLDIRATSNAPQPNRKAS